MTDFRGLSDEELQVQFMTSFYGAGDYAREILRREEGDLDWNGFLADHPEIARHPGQQVADVLGGLTTSKEARLHAIRQLIER